MMSEHTSILSILHRRQAPWRRTPSTLVRSAAVSLALDLCWLGFCGGRRKETARKQCMDCSSDGLVVTVVPIVVALVVQVMALMIEAVRSGFGVGRGGGSSSSSNDQKRRWLIEEG